MTLSTKVRGALYLGVALALTAPLAHADTAYTVSGTYDGSTASSPVSAANTDFSMTFSIPSPVVPSGGGSDFFSVIEDMAFSLGGGPAQTITGIKEEFFTTAKGATFEVDCELGCSLSAANGGEDFNWKFTPSPANQLFSGTTTTPTMLTGTFPVDTTAALSFYSDSVSGAGAGHFTNATIVASSGTGSVPEPFSLGSLGGGLLLVLWARSRLRASRRS